MGLYAFVAGALLYALIGTDRHLSVGADSTIAPVLAVGVGAVAAVGSSGYGSAMAFTAIVVGAILVGAGSVAAGLMGTLAVDASPPNTAIATASGTRSQLANVMAALVVVVVAVGLTAPSPISPRRRSPPPWSSSPPSSSVSMSCAPSSASTGSSLPWPR